MINRDDGSLSILETKLRPRMPEVAFLESPLASGAERTAWEGGGHSYAQYILKLGSELQAFGILLTFEDASLRYVDIASRVPDVPLAARSGHSEKRRKTEHDRILKRWLGRPPYRFGWGSVESELDPKTGDASITISYSGGA